jgi:hypothetical protein
VISLPRGAIKRANPTPDKISTRTGPRITPARAKATCPRTEPQAFAWAPPPTAEPIRDLGKPLRSAAAAAAAAAAPLRRLRAVPTSRLAARRARQGRAGERHFAAEGGGYGSWASSPKTTPAVAGRRGGWTVLGRATLQLPRRGRTATEEGGRGGCWPPRPATTRRNRARIRLKGRCMKQKQLSARGPTGGVVGRFVRNDD